MDSSLAAGETSTTAGLAFVEILHARGALQQLVCRFETNIVNAHKIPLRVAHQPVSTVYVQHSSVREHIAGLFSLNGFNQERLDGSVQHDCF
jgi:hypothetical protein